MEFDELSNKVIGCAFKVHSVLGPGLLESAYEQCLARELRLSGFEVKIQVPMPVEYKNLPLKCGYRLDLVADDSLIVELKSVEALRPIHQAQLITYLNLSEIKVRLLINFNVKRLKDGIKQLVV
ncbi:MAG: GxxExxY protein [Candidatus Dadabacteria bacterium]|nr:MAG: GxxExxY protein [Candidatus Dadabacteria bacterium]